MCCKLCKSVLLFVIPLNSRVHMCGVCVPESVHTEPPDSSLVT